MASEGVRNVRQAQWEEGNSGRERERESCSKTTVKCNEGLPSSRVEGDKKSWKKIG